MMRHGLILILSVVWWLAGPVQAADFLVNSTADLGDARPGDGSCDTGSGQCTLRAAIQEANALARADTVTMPTGFYTLTRGALGITDDLTIIGADAVTTIINGGALNQVLLITAPSVKIWGVALQYGVTDEPSGGIFLPSLVCIGDWSDPPETDEPSGGIFLPSFSTLTLTERLSGNSGH